MEAPLRILWIYRQRLKELGEGILKLSEMKHKDSSSADLEKQKEKVVEALTRQVDEEKSTYYEQSDELGDLEKAEARFNKLMDAFRPANRLE